jgi:hypothetical protein
MSSDPVKYDLVIRYLDPYASEEDLQQARELLLNSPEARSFLLEVTRQMVFLQNRVEDSLELSFLGDTLGEFTNCHLRLQPSSVDTASSTQVSAASNQIPIWIRPFKTGSRVARYAALFPIILTLILAGNLFYQNRQKPILQGGLEATASDGILKITDYLAEVTIINGDQSVKSPFNDLPLIRENDVIQTPSWFSWIEFKTKSGTSLTVLASSRVKIRSLTKERISLDVFEGAVRIKSAKDDPMEFYIESERLKTTSVGADMLVWDFDFFPAMGACFAGNIDVESKDGTQKVVVEGGFRGIFDYDTDLSIIPLPKINDSWTSQGMISQELGNGLWNDSNEPGKVKLLTSPKSYLLPDGSLQQINEILIAVWRKPDMVSVKDGSHLIISGKVTRKGPVSFSLRTHSEYGKLLDVFVKTIPADELPEPGQEWHVKIPVETMTGTYKPGQSVVGSFLFNIGVYTLDEIGLEVQSIDFKPPD